jgi:hypothetical protein
MNKPNPGDYSKFNDIPFGGVTPNRDLQEAIMNCNEACRRDTKGRGK